MFIDDGVIVTSSTTASGGRPGRLERSAIPSTLTGVLQARLDTLDGGQRRTLQCASVVGRVFWDDAVSALTGDEDVTEEALDDARPRELVFRRDHTSFEDAGEYLFKHALLCDVTYETVLLRDRPMLHGRVAAWLESAAGERMAEYHEMIAGHLRAAGEPAPGRRAPVARRPDAPGHRHARRGGGSLRAAVELWDAAGVDAPCDALLVLGEALLRVDDIGTAEAFLERARRRRRRRRSESTSLASSSWIADLSGRPRSRALPPRTSTAAGRGSGRAEPDTHPDRAGVVVQPSRPSRRGRDTPSGPRAGRGARRRRRDVQGTGGVGDGASRARRPRGEPTPRRARARDRRAQREPRRAGSGARQPRHRAPPPRR